MKVKVIRIILVTALAQTCDFVIRITKLIQLNGFGQYPFTERQNPGVVNDPTPRAKNAI